MQDLDVSYCYISCTTGGEVSLGIQPEPPVKKPRAKATTSKAGTTKTKAAPKAKGKTAEANVRYVTSRSIYYTRFRHRFVFSRLIASLLAFTHRPKPCSSSVRLITD